MADASFDWRGLKLSFCGVIIAILAIELAAFFPWLPARVLVAAGLVLGVAGSYMHLRAMRRDAREWLKNSLPAQGEDSADRDQ